MLSTNLDHIEEDESLREILSTHENVVVCCGRMGPMCLPVYAALEDLRDQYPHVACFDQDFDGPAAAFIQNLPACASFMGLPFTVYFKNGQAVAATTSVQSPEEVKAILDREFGKAP
jgi:thioredoxin 1